MPGFATWNSATGTPLKALKFTVNHGGDPSFFSNDPKAILLINELKIPVDKDMFTINYKILTVDSTSCEIEFYNY